MKDTKNPSLGDDILNGCDPPIGSKVAQRHKHKRLALDYKKILAKVVTIYRLVIYIGKQ